MLMMRHHYTTVFSSSLGFTRTVDLVLVRAHYSRVDRLLDTNYGMWLQDSNASICKSPE